MLKTIKWTDEELVNVPSTTWIWTVDAMGNLTGLGDLGFNPKMVETGSFGAQLLRLPPKNRGNSATEIPTSGEGRLLRPIALLRPRPLGRWPIAWRMWPLCLVTAATQISSDFCCALDAP